MNPYKEFAQVYSRGPYPEYTTRIARLLPKILRRFELRPRTLLDVACGEGTFAISMARRGLHSIGVDQSAEMLRFARHRAREKGVKATFARMDMRRLNFDNEFDLVTCWYDSLNYLLKIGDLKKTFTCISSALRKQGLFIFDMNTIYGLSVRWQQYPSNVQQDSQGIFEVHRPEYDEGKKIAALRVTAFLRTGKLWKRLDELHREKGYSLSQIRSCLKAAGLTELACWGSIRKMTPPKRDSGRVWFVARRR